MSEPNFSPYGYDVNKHQKPELVRHLQILTAKKEFNGKWNESMRKPELLYIIEKHHAQARERAGENPKDYLKDDFEPEKCTNAKLRQIFAQYDIKYPAQNPKKEFLVEIFEDNISKLRTLNKRATADNKKSKTSANKTATTSPSSHRTASVASSHRSTSATSAKSNEETGLKTPRQTPMHDSGNESSEPEALELKKLLKLLTLQYAKAVKKVEKGEFADAAKKLDLCTQACVELAKNAEEEGDDQSDHELEHEEYHGQEQHETAGEETD